MLYDSARRPPPSIEEIIENWRHRDLLGELVGRDIKLRYKRSSLGILWSMLNPLLMMVVLTLIFSNIFKFAISDYPVYLLSGTVVWTFFAQSTTNAMTSLRWGGALFSKIYLPRTSFALTSVGTNIVNLALALVPLLLIASFFGRTPAFSLLWVPVGIVLAALFALGVGLLLSSFAVIFPDVIDIYQVLLTAWYFLTPVMYPREILPESYQWMVDVNPITPLVDIFRAAVYTRTSPDPLTLLIALAWGIAAAVIGWVVFAARGDELGYKL